MMKDPGSHAEEVSHGSVVKGEHWKFRVCARDMAMQVLKMGQG